MRQRQLPETTVAGLFDLIAPVRTNVRTTLDSMSVDLTNDHVIRIAPEFDSMMEVPASGDAVIALGNWLDIPSKFLSRIDLDLAEHILNTMLQRSSDSVIAQIGNDELVDVIPLTAHRVDPRQVVEVAVSVLGEDAPVVEYRRDGTGYGFDVTVDTDSAFGVGGDVAVGDITRGGLRFGHDTKHNLTPWVQRYLFRLVCTNGMEVPDATTSINARGLDPDDIISELESIARTSFAKVTGDIRAFYDLRNTVVNNPDQTLVRLAQENGVSERTIGALVADLPEYTTNGQTTMFDLVNLITNFANADSLSNRFNARRTLEVIGGGITYDHSTRCPSCASKLS